MLIPSVLIANCVNPILTVFLAAAPFVGVRKSGCWEFWGRTALALGLAVVLAESGKYFQVWPGHPSFPSGHETFGLCAAANLALSQKRANAVKAALHAHGFDKVDIQTAAAGDAGAQTAAGQNKPVRRRADITFHLAPPPAG